MLGIEVSMFMFFFFGKRRGSLVEVFLLSLLGNSRLSIDMFFFGVRFRIRVRVVGSRLVGRN